MVRIALLKDIPQLTQLMIKLLVHHQEFHSLYAVDFDNQNELDHFFSDVLSQENIHIYVAEIEENLVGFIICSKHSRPNYFTIKSKGRIDSLFVEKEFRSHHLASKLVEKAISFLQNEPYIELEFTAENQLAKSFWLNKGFKILNHQAILKM